MASPPRKLFVTADLHFGTYPTGDACTRALADFACARSADVLAIAGDIGAREPQTFVDCLGLFEDFAGARVLVPGNHDVWRNGDDSETLYTTILPRLSEQAGFHMLDVSPLILGNVAFIGSIGWYDYSFRNEGLGLREEDYAAKTLAGVCTWNDLRFVNWDWSDVDFTGRCVEALMRHHSMVAEAQSVITVIHHLPFRELLYPPSRRAYEFVRAYMGAECVGRLIQSWPNLRYVFCGHRHGHERMRVNAFEVACVGSEYMRKRLLEVDLENDVCKTHLFEQDSGNKVVHTVED